MADASPTMPALTPATIQPFFDNFGEIAFHKYLGMELAEYRDGYAKVELTRTDTTPTGIGGSVNGGVLATLVDMTAVTSVLAGLQEGEHPAGTADIQITYLRQTKGETVTCEAHVLKRGKQLAAVDVNVTDDTGRICCTARVLYAFRA